jgi:hypothetical protein
MDAVDMCARSPNMPQGREDDISTDWVMEWAEGNDTSHIVLDESMGEWIPRWKKTLTQAERRARPFANIAEAQRSKSRGDILKAREKWWQDLSSMGVWSPNWAMIIHKWKPVSTTDLPPGFLNMYELVNELDGEEDRTQRRVVQKYADLLGVSNEEANAHMLAMAEAEMDKAARGQGELFWF